MSVARAYWNQQHSCYTRDEIRMDDWLQPFDALIQACTTPIIDLGCGSGNDTKHLIALGKSVIACDFAPNAIANIRRNFPKLLDAMCFDMTEGLPFPNSYTDLIIADLSLHYFTESVTTDILKDLRRVLKPNGTLLLRVNSVKDTNHGAGQGTEIEPHLYKTADGRLKRFFDEGDIRRFFADWHIVSCMEENLTRYALPKVLWTVVCQA